MLQKVKEEREVSFKECAFVYILKRCSRKSNKKYTISSLPYLGFFYFIKMKEKKIIKSNLHEVLKIEKKPQANKFNASKTEH